MTDNVEEKNPSPDGEKSLRRGRAGLWLGAGLGLAVLTGLLAAVAIRTQIAEIIAKDIVANRADAPLLLDVTRLGVASGEIRDIALGAANGPGLRVARTQARWRVGARSA